MSNEDKHVECISDYCGNAYKDCGAWADIYERPDGSRYITLGGGWEFWATNPPDVIEDSNEHYTPFIEACAKCEDFGYAATHWGNPNPNK